MFQYEYEKRPASRTSAPRDWPSRPLPPRPGHALHELHELHALPPKPSVPLRVWIIASASCFAVCGALVLATIIVTRWGSSDSYVAREMYAEAREPIYPNPYPLQPQPVRPASKTTTTESTSQEDDIQFPILEKLSIFKNIVANRDKKKEDKNLIFKPQLHPMHDTSLQHPDKKIEKKDQAKLPQQVIIPEFKPTLPDVFLEDSIKLSDGYIAGLKKIEDTNYEEYYNDDNLYDDYMQSNTMTSYLIEKIQELHDWITSDPELEGKADKQNDDQQFGQLLKSLNESLLEGNVSIVMSKLKDLYFGENFTASSQNRKVILSNSTNLLSFGILTLDVMLLHNIQLMAWETQESARNKMLRDPDVFAFNALFMEPARVEAKRSEVHHQRDAPHTGKRQNRQEDEEPEKNLLENVLEIGMSTARAAIHLGRAFKNTKAVLSQLSSSNRESLAANIQAQMSRNSDANTHALQRLQASYNESSTSSSASAANLTAPYTDLDCMWLLYCRNLVATAKLNAPYGTMARINGLALRMLTGELVAERALDSVLMEALTGWTELRCGDMFPRCSKVNAAAVVLDSILQPLRKSPATSRSTNTIT